MPLAASLNAVVQHLANYTEVGEDPEDAAEDDPDTLPAGVSGEDVADVDDSGTSGRLGLHRLLWLAAS